MPFWLPLIVNGTDHHEHLSASVHPGFQMIFIVIAASAAGALWLSFFSPNCLKDIPSAEPVFKACDHLLLAAAERVIQFMDVIVAGDPGRVKPVDHAD